MNMDNVKKDSDIKLPAGLTSEVERHDGNARRVTIRDSSGAVVLVVAGDYGVSILVPSPPKMVKKFRLAGTLKGLKYEENFDDKYSAEVRATELESFDEKGTITEVEVVES